MSYTYTHYTELIYILAAQAIQAGLHYRRLHTASLLLAEITTAQVEDLSQSVFQEGAMTFLRPKKQQKGTDTESESDRREG